MSIQSSLEKGGGRNRRFGFFHFHPSNLPSETQELECSAPLELSRSRFALRTVGKICRKFLQEEDGQGVIEYILLLSVTVVGAGFLARGILNALDSGILKLGGQLEKDLKTGRAPLSVYQN